MRASYPGPLFAWFPVTELPHNRRRRRRRHGRTALVKFGLRHRVKLAVQLRELVSSLSICLRRELWLAEFFALTEQPISLGAESFAARIFGLVRSRPEGRNLRY